MTKTGFRPAFGPTGTQWRRRAFGPPPSLGPRISYGGGARARVPPPCVRLCVCCLKGVCLLHLLSENIFPVLRSNWFYVLMKEKWIWNLSLCYFSLFCFYLTGYDGRTAERKSDSTWRTWTNFEGISFPQTNQLANSRDAISRHLYYKVFK